MSITQWYGTGQFTAFNGLNIFFQRSGTGQALICIHGFPSSSWDFEAIWPSITRQFDVFAPDLIGLGKSAKPQQPLPIRL